MRRAKFSSVALVAGMVGLFPIGCHHGGVGFRRASGPVLEPLSKEDAVRLVNNNIAQIKGTLRATGSVDGHFVNADSNRRVNYNVDGTLFYLSPYYLRFDLKKLGDRQVLFGSNDQHYWAYTKDDDAYVCGCMDGSDADRAEFPIPPEQIIEALGLTPIPDGGANAEMRVQPEYQQIVFGGREYWLDRRAPRLVRKVIFRDADETVAMTSDLSDYRPMPGGLILPHLINAEWPGRSARLRFDVGRWTAVGEVVPGGPQFATPAECLRGGSPDVARPERL